MTSGSLQDTYAPGSLCFGCGPQNDKGLRIKTFAERDDACVCHWRPEPHHLAFAGVLNGGVCGVILDCHSNWTAAWHLMRRGQLAAPPCTVTAEFTVRLKRPTPVDGPLALLARVVASNADRATVEAQIAVDGVITATCRGIFVAVKEGHPAFRRW
ncbi:MAG: PaaI family thioesterase [Myxococcota bacterium]|nr:PaaI family thioesterase [Myxococcota bacterium]